MNRFIRIHKANNLFFRDLCHNKISSIDRNAFINSSNLWML